MEFKKIRESCRVTQRELAMQVRVKLGVCNQGHISRIENGVSVPEKIYETACDALSRYASGELKPIWPMDTVYYKGRHDPEECVSKEKAAELKKIRKSLGIARREVCKFVKLRESHLKDLELGLYRMTRKMYEELTAFYEKKGRKIAKKVFICSPFHSENDHELLKNMALARELCSQAVKEGCIPYAPHLYFPLFLKDCDPKERELGITMGLEWLSKCDELWFAGDKISEGMQREFQEARRLGIPIKYR